MQIYLIRHGETDWNKANRIQGQVDIPLNDYGIRLAEETAEALKEVPFEAVFCSPYVRARKTADIITEAVRRRYQEAHKEELPFTIDNRLKEIGFAHREGAYIAEIVKNPEDPVYNFLRRPERYQPEAGGESFQELFARSKNFMEEIIRPLEGIYETVLIVAHSALIHSIINPLAGLGLEDFWKIPFKNCNVSTVQLEHGVFRLEEASIQYCACRV